MSEKKKKARGLSTGKKLEKIRENLEESAEILRESPPTIENVKKNRKEIAEKLKKIEENVRNVKRLLQQLRSKKNNARVFEKLPAPKKKEAVQFLTEEEYRKLYPKKRKAVVYYQKSDFSSLDEYIEYMRRPPISDEEVGAADWDVFLQKLEKWKPSK